MHLQWKPEVHLRSSVNKSCSKETWLDANTALTKWARFGCPGQNSNRAPVPLGNVVTYSWKQVPLSILINTWILDFCLGQLNFEMNMENINNESRLLMQNVTKALYQF